MPRMVQILAFVLTVAVTGTVAADDRDRAQRLAQDAKLIADAKDFGRAAALFREAYAIDARPEYQCNAGIAYFKARDLPAAQLFLTLCLEGASNLEEKHAKSVRTLLAKVDTELRAGDYGPVDLRVTPATAAVRIAVFGQDAAFTGSRVVWLRFGEHVIAASAPGHVPGETTLTVDSHTARSVELALAAEAPAPATRPQPEPEPPALSEKAAPLSTPAPVDRPEPVPPVDAAPRGGFSRRTAITATAITGGVAVASVGCYVMATREADRAGELEPGPDYEAARTRARRWRGAAYGGYAATAVAGAVSIYLWTHLAPSSPVAVGASGSGDGGAVWVQGRF